MTFNTKAEKEAAIKGFIDMSLEEIAEHYPLGKDNQKRRKLVARPAR